MRHNVLDNSGPKTDFRATNRRKTTSFRFLPCLPCLPKPAPARMRRAYHMMDRAADRERFAMTTKGTSFIIEQELPWEVAAPGVRRKVLCYTDDLMMVKVAFEEGAIGAMHQHPHIQSCLVESGVFDITIDGEMRRLYRGDGYLVEGGVPHGAVAIEAGALIDTFTPMPVSSPRS